MWQSRHKWHCVTNFSVTSGWYHTIFAVTFDIIYSLSCLWRINFIQVTGQKYKNCYFRLKCYFCKCAEIKSWHIYVWSQHLCKRLDSSCDVLRPKTNIPTPFTPRITMFCRFLWTHTVFRMGPAASGRGRGLPDGPDPHEMPKTWNLSYIWFRKRCQNALKRALKIYINIVI